MPTTGNKIRLIRDALITPIGSASSSSHGALAHLAQPSSDDHNQNQMEARQKLWAEAFLKRIEDGNDQVCFEALRNWIEEERKGNVPPLASVLPRVFYYVYLKLEFDDQRGSMMGSSSAWNKLKGQCGGSRKDIETLGNRLKNTSPKGEIGALADPRIANLGREYVAEGGEALARLERFLLFESESRDSRNLQQAQSLLRAGFLVQILPSEWYSGESRWWPDLATFMTSTAEVLMAMKSEAGKPWFRKRKLKFNQDMLKSEAQEARAAFSAIVTPISALSPTFYDDLVAGTLHSGLQSMQDQANQKYIAALNSPPPVSSAPRQTDDKQIHPPRSGAELKVNLASFKQILSRVSDFNCDELKPQMLTVILDESLNLFDRSLPHARCFLYRIVNLMEMSADPRWSRFAEGNGSDMTLGEIPEALVIAATLCPLHAHGKDFTFDPDEYFDIAAKGEDVNGGVN